MTSLEDMRLFAQVAARGSFTGAARVLGMPKQTLSRRVAELEQDLGVQLLVRTTRKLHLTDVGAAYAERCAEIARLADEANRSVTDAHATPRGTLRVTANPVFGEAFVTGLIIEYAARWPEVQVEVVLTRRHVNVLEEGFDVAFRIGPVDEPRLTATSLGPARVRYCASPAYLKRRGRPLTPEDLAAHDCVVVTSDATPVRWPFQGPRGPRFVPVTGRVRVSSFPMAHDAVRAGLGVAVFPEFACAADVRARRLATVLDEHVIEVGGVWLVHPTQRYFTARVRTFVELALERLARDPPWVGPTVKRRR